MRKIHYIAFLMLASGMTAGILLSLLSNKSAEEQGLAVYCDPGERQHTYTCAMHPSVVNPRQGRCPVCEMRLVLRNPLAQAGRAALILDQRSAALGGIATQPLGDQLNSVHKYFETTGQLQLPEHSVYRQQSYVPGRIDRLYIETEGEYVQKGQRIARVFSKELIAVIEAFRYSKGSEAVLRAAENNLKAWKIDKSRIMDMLQSDDYRRAIDIYADKSGYVQNLMVREGDQVGGHSGHSSHLFDIAKTDELIAILNIDRRILPLIDSDTDIELELPGSEISSAARYVRKLPFSKDGVNGQIQVALGMTGQPWIPGTAVKAVLEYRDSTDPAFHIPSSALLYTGNNSSVYIKVNAGQEGMDKFERKEVQVVAISKDGYMINSHALKPADELVVLGASTLDAAAQLEGKASVINRKAVMERTEDPTVVAWKNKIIK